MLEWKVTLAARKLMSDSYLESPGSINLHQWCAVVGKRFFENPRIMLEITEARKRQPGSRKFLAQEKRAAENQRACPL